MNRERVEVDNKILFAVFLDCVRSKVFRKWGKKVPDLNVVNLVLKPALIDFWPLEEHNIDILSYKAVMGNILALALFTHGATFPIHSQSCNPGNLTNVSQIFALLFALFWSPPEGNIGFWSR